MKKLGKLNFNPEKLIKNEELMTLRGGYETGDCHCMCYNDDPIPAPMGLMAAMNQIMCTDNCHDVDPDWSGSWNCMY